MAILFLVVLWTGAAFYAGVRVGLSHAFLRDRRLADGPEPLPEGRAAWTAPAPAGDRTPSDTGGPPPRTEAPGGTSAAKEPGPRGEAPKADVAPFFLDVTQPLRISFPLDVGPEVSPDAPDRRPCLRARQGANEIQTPGSGRALYAFRLAQPGRYQAYCHVRWTDDGIGSVDCNNSWFAGFDDQPLAVVGNEEEDTDWFWEPGPAAELDAGLHWLRVELREDGPVMDRAVIARADQPPGAETFEKAPRAAPTACAGARPPLDPQHPLQDVECWALPTQSLAIGRGQVNEVTVGVSWLGAGPGFRGRIAIRAPTAPGLKVEGTPEISAGPDAPFARRVLTLRFPEDAARRSHAVSVAVVEEGSRREVLRQELAFLKGCAWAFLGPFRDTSEGSKSMRRGTGALEALKQPCDDAPDRLARLAPPRDLGLESAPLAGKGRALEWQIVADGSCYDWTGAVDLLRVFGRTGPAYAYAVTWIHAETRLFHRSFSFQADDAGWLWVNGDVLVSLPMDLPKEANRLWSSARLNPGPNPVVVKLTQNQRYWGFRFDVIDWHWQGRRGDVITGLEPDRWPR